MIHVSRLTPRHSWPTAAAALALCGGLLAAQPASANAAAAPVLAGDPTALVNPFLGTGDGGGVVGPVNEFPGASAPFGMGIRPGR